MSIGLTTVVLFAVFGILLFLSCPISVSIVIASIVTAVSSLSWDQITFITMQKMNSGVESFSLLAIPLFILAGNIMNNGGIARRLVNFSKLFVGWIPGSLAQANIVGNMVFASGQIPIDPATGEIVEGGIAEQTTRVLENVKAVLEAAGTSLDNVIKTTCFMDNMDDFGKMNEVYASFFTGEILPSRSAVEVSRLPKGVLIEIEVIAVL